MKQVFLVLLVEFLAALAVLFLIIHFLGGQPVEKAIREAAVVSLIAAAVTGGVLLVAAKKKPKKK